MRQELQSSLAQARTLAPEELPRLLGDLEEFASWHWLGSPATCVRTEAPDTLLEVPEASARLGVSANYLYRNSKRFAFTRRQGRKLLFSSRGIEQHIRKARS
jgi:hypothetical protein